ncbi:MAG TPA: putative lipid II flippase FtsW, partial [Chloroflexi bacterium]|nr:putative lipid II flippase FtsW [Chloroflexota bacterium]
FWLIFQALINIAVATATLPFTGIPLPFVSYGGSSLIVSMAGVGLLLSISRSAQEREAEESADRDFGWWYRRPRVSGLGRR